MQPFVSPLLGPAVPPARPRAASPDEPARRPFNDELRSHLSRSDERAAVRRTDKPPPDEPPRDDPADSAAPDRGAPEPDTAPRADEGKPGPAAAEPATEPTEAPASSEAPPSQGGPIGEATVPAESTTITIGSSVPGRLLADLGVLSAPSSPGGVATTLPDSTVRTGLEPLPTALPAAPSTAVPVTPGTEPQAPTLESTPSTAAPATPAAGGNAGLLDGGDGQSAQDNADGRSRSPDAQRHAAPAPADAPRAAAAAQPAPTTASAAPSTVETLRASIVESYDSAAGEAAAKPVGGADAPTEPLATQVARALVVVSESTPKAPEATTSTAPAPATEPVAPVVDAAGTVPEAGPATAVERTPTTAAAPTAPQAPAVRTDDANVDNIVRTVNGTVGTRDGRVRLQLDPPELGQMRIDVRVQKDTITLRIQVESEAALARIQSTASQLKHSLEQQGLVVERFDVQLRGTGSSADRSGSDEAKDFRPADQHQTFERERPEDRDASPDAGLGTAADDNELPSDDPNHNRDDAPHRRRLTPAAVDLWA